MKKITGKALSLVLSLALVVSSFSAGFASAATKTLAGKLTGDYTDEFYLVNGGTGADLVYESFGAEINSAPSMETPDHETVSDVDIAAISHKSGDRLVKWYDTEGSNSKSSIGDDTQTANVDLELRSSTVSGEEVISVLYKGTYTDEDDKEYTVKASKDITIRVYDKYETVVGLTGTAEGDKGELDEDFAQKTLAHEKLSGSNDTKPLTVLQAVPGTTDKLVVGWQELKTVSDDTTIPANDKTIIYTLKSSTSNVELTNAATVTTPATLVLNGSETGSATAALNGDNTKIVITKGTAVEPVTVKIGSGAATEVDFGEGTTAEISLPTTATTITLTDSTTGTALVNTYSFTPAEATPNGVVNATVKNNAGTGTVTFSAKPTAYAKNLPSTATYAIDGANKLFSTSEVKQKSNVTKTIKVTSADTSYLNLGKLGTNTYIYSGTLSNDNDAKYKVNGFEVKFDNITDDIKVDDKAAVTKISGKVKSLNIASGSVQGIALKNDTNETVPTINVSDAKVGDIDFDDAGGNVVVDSSDATVGNITDATEVDVNGGKVGNIDADDKVVVKAEDDESSVTLGDISSKDIEIDSQDSKVTVGTIKATDSGTEILLEGDNVTVKAIDFNNYDVALTLQDFTGTIPAPANATKDGSSVSTEGSGDKVTITGSAKINSISIADESTMIFADSAEIGSIDGSGTLVVGLNKLYVTSDASGVILKLNAASYGVGDTVFTAVSDTVDVDDFDCYGFTLSKAASSAKDTFKIASTEFKGLTIDPASASITKGYSQTFKAVPYAPGTSLPAGYSIGFVLDGDEDIFDLVDNGNGTATVAVTDYDSTFPSENKATLKAVLLDENGDEDDDYDAGESDLAATLVVPVVSDTTSNFSVAPGASYTFKLTSPTVPVLTVGTAGVFSVTDMGKSGNDYFVKITAIGKVGAEAGIYVNGTKLLVASIKSGITSDTTTDITVKKGASYTYKITAPSAPTFSVGTANVLTYKLTSQSGNNYFYQITAVGAVGAKAGIYVNGEKINAVTIG